MILSALVLATLTQTPQSYLTEALKWRIDRETALKRTDGWLSVAGLVWDTEGDSSIGSKKGSKIQISGIPAEVGKLTITKRKASLTVNPGADVKVNGMAVTGTVAIKTDADGVADAVQFGTESFKVIVRGARIGARIFDSNSVFMKEFSGCHWYPVNENFRIKAKYTAYTPPRKVNIMNILGDVDSVAVPGYVEFVIDGKSCQLDAQEEGDTLFFNFKDFTSGTITYPAGRFLNVPKPVDGFVDLDFNKAINPPCAFTSFATCPLPPSSNILKVRISAGELNHHPAH